jgi:hypothetical protein
MTGIDIFGIPPHLAAEVFPLLDEDERFYCVNFRCA